MKSGNLNFLEPSGPVQDCNGTAFNILHYTVLNGMAELEKDEAKRPTNV